MKRQWNSSVEGGRLFLQRAVARGQYDADRMGENYLTAIPRDALACILRWVERDTLQSLFRFLCDAYGIATRRLFTTYDDGQDAVLRLMDDALRRHDATHTLAQDLARQYFTGTNGTHDEAAEQTTTVVRANRYTALLLFVVYGNVA